MIFLAVIAAISLPTCRARTATQITQSWADRRSADFCARSIQAPYLEAPAEDPPIVSPRDGTVVNNQPAIAFRIRRAGAVPRPAVPLLSADVSRRLDDDLRFAWTLVHVATRPHPPRSNGGHDAIAKASAEHLDLASLDNVKARIWSRRRLGGYRVSALSPAVTTRVVNLRRRSQVQRSALRAPVGRHATAVTDGERPGREVLGDLVEVGEDDCCLLVCPASDQPADEDLRGLAFPGQGICG
jgi:hypothetical protein